MGIPAVRMAGKDMVKGKKGSKAGKSAAPKKRLTKAASIKKSSESLVDSENLFHTLADTAQDMIFIVNRKGIVEYVNRASAEQFKIKADRFIGRRLSDFFPTYNANRQSLSLERVFKSGKPFYIANDTMFPGGKKLLDTWLVPIKDKSGKVTSVFGISRDVTNYKHISEELELKTTEAEEAKARAQTYFDFLAHDIANLISPVLTYSDELAKQGLDSPDADVHLNKIYEQTQRTARLIMDIRMLVEAEKCPQNTHERFDLGEFFHNLEQMAARDFPGRCKMVIDIPKGAPIEVIGGMHIKNAFMQGFSHAMGEADAGCIDVNVKILSTKKDKRQFWQVRMDMPGRPVTRDWQERVVPPFDPWRRTKGRSIESIAFSSAIVRHFGGNMRVEHLDKDDPSKGQTVVIELPKAGTWHGTRNT